VLRHVLSRVYALAPAATVALVADARALLPLHAAVCAMNLRPYQARALTHACCARVACWLACDVASHATPCAPLVSLCTQLDREGALDAAAAAASSGRGGALCAAARAAAAACDVLLLTHAQLGAAAAEHGGGDALSDIFQFLVLYTPPPAPHPGSAAASAAPGVGAAAAALHALLLAPQRRFCGEVHVCVVRLPRAEDAPPAALAVHAHRAPTRDPAPQPREEPVPPPPQQQQQHYVRAEAPPAPQQQPQRRWSDDDGGDDGGFARLLVATSGRSAVLRAWPALRDAVLRLEGRCGASVAERELTGGGVESDADADASADAPSRLLRCPDALFLGASGAVWALRVLRGTSDHALLAAATAPAAAQALGAALRALGARCDGLALVVVCGSSATTPGDDDAVARAAAPRAAALAGAAAAAGLPLRASIAVGDAAVGDAALAVLCAAAAPPDAPPRLRALPDAPPAGEALLRCCAGLNALSAHALLCSGMSLATLLRPDITDAISVAAASATGGVFLSARALAAFDAFRAMPLGGALQLPVQGGGGGGGGGDAAPCAAAQMYDAVLQGGGMGVQHQAQMHMPQQQQQPHAMMMPQPQYAEQMMQHEQRGPVPQAPPSWAPPQYAEMAPPLMQHQQHQAWEEAQAAAARASWQSAPAPPGGWREARALAAAGAWPPQAQPPLTAAAPPVPQPPQYVNPYAAPPPPSQQQQQQQPGVAHPRRRALDDIDFLFEEEEEPAAWMLPPPEQHMPQYEQLQQQQYMQQHAPQQHGAPLPFAVAYEQQMQQQLQQQMMPQQQYEAPPLYAPAPQPRSAANSARSGAMGRAGALGGGGVGALGVGGTRPGAQLDDLLGAWLAKVRVVLAAHSCVCVDASMPSLLC
jgi:hypothetical protein